MSDNSIFALLLRSPWWVSMLVALLFWLPADYLLPEQYAFYAFSFSIPFVMIGLIVAWRQLQEPGAARIASTVERLAAMSWRDFQALMERAFEKDGYTVARINVGAADFRLLKAGRVTVVCCKRWKAASHGVEPLQELENAREAQEANQAIFIAMNGISYKATRFAANHGIQLMPIQELTRLVKLAK